MPQVQLNDFTMHYVEQGSGPEPIILVAGFISTTNWWRPTLERLAPDAYRVYALDMRASGGSEQIATGHTLAQYAEDVHEFVERTGLQNFTLVGHSMGGGIAMQYALGHQERLKALILVDPLSPLGMKLDQATTDWINSVQGQEEGQRMVVLGGYVTPPEDAHLQQLVADAVAWGKPIYHGMMEDMARFNVSSHLPAITVPTLVTWGDRDMVIPFEGIADAFTKIPGCALEVWHGVGHCGPIEIPDRFVELLTRFISEASKRGS